MFLVFGLVGVVVYCFSLLFPFSFFLYDNGGVFFSFQYFFRHLNLGSTPKVIPPPLYKGGEGEGGRGVMEPLPNFNALTCV